MESAAVDETFPYFAYGSNLLIQRIRLQNSTAEFVTVARLENYRLEFAHSVADSWKGASATINKSESGDHVWGAVWRMNKSDLPNIDDQEGVPLGIYEAIEVEVTNAANEKFVCRSYRMVNAGSGDQRPSPHYLDVIVRGAVQLKLPEYYIDRLRSFEHNGYKGSVSVYDRLKLDAESAQIKIK